MIVKVPVVDPAGTVIVAGIETSLSDEDKLTTRLPVGAELKVTVPVVEQPPVIVLGEKLSDEMESPTTVRIAFAFEYWSVA